MGDVDNDKSSHGQVLRCHKVQPFTGTLWPSGSHGGNHVEVEGSFDNWTMRQPMQRSGKDFTIVKLLPPGVYQVPPGRCIKDHAPGRQLSRAGAVLGVLKASPKRLAKLLPAHTISAMLAPRAKQQANVDGQSGG